MYNFDFVWIRKKNPQYIQTVEEFHSGKDWLKFNDPNDCDIHAHEWTEPSDCSYV